MRRASARRCGSCVVLPGHALEPGAAQREVGGLGAGEHRRADDQRAAARRAGAPTPSLRHRPLRPVHEVLEPACRPARRVPRDRRYSMPLAPLVISPTAVRLVPVRVARGPVPGDERAGRAGQQQLVVLAAPGGPGERVARRAPRDGVRRWPRRSARRPTSTPGARSRSPRTEWPRSVARPSERSIIAVTPPASASHCPSRTRGRGRRWAPVTSASASPRRCRPAPCSRSSTASPAAERPSEPVTATTSPARAVERRSGGATASPSRVTLMIQPAGETPRCRRRRSRRRARREGQRALVERLDLVGGPCLRGRPARQRPARAPAHRGDVREVHRERLPADVRRRGPAAAEVNVLDAADRSWPAAAHRGCGSSTAQSSPMPTRTAGRPPAPGRTRGRALARLARSLAPSSPIRSARKFREQLLALDREDRLGMELHALDRVAAMAKPHDLAVLGPGRDLERRRAPCRGSTTSEW